MKAALLDHATQRRTRWKNDGGWTTEIARDPPAGEDFRWRISIAEIECDGPFSSFPGIDRDLLLLDGAGIELDIGRRAPQRLTQRFARVHFAGEAAVRCRLLDGPTRDFNVMTRRAAVSAEIVVRPLLDSMVIFAQSEVEWLLYTFAGRAVARSGTETFALETGSSLHLDFRGADAERVVIDGVGELVMVKFVAVDDQERIAQEPAIAHPGSFRPSDDNAQAQPRAAAPARISSAS